MKRNRIRDLRKKHNHTQADLAGLLGVSRQTIITYEKTDEAPRWAMYAIAYIYGVAAGEIDVKVKGGGGK